MKKIFSILFALVLVLSFSLVTAPLVLAGTIRNVPGNYRTIQAAIDAASDGDTIMVAAGEYDAFVVQQKTNISIISTEGATVATASLITALPVVGNAWVMAAVYDSQNIDIKGISFDGTGVSGKPVAVGIAYVDSTGEIADLTVENIVATDLGTGMAIIGDVSTSTVEITGAVISNNDDTGIYVCGGSTLEAHFNKIVDNAQCGVLNDGGGMVDATRNWWGHKSGPWHLTNPLGLGNPVIGDVNFKPWLGAGDIVIQTATNATVNATAEADTEVVVKGTATVTIAKYASNPHPTAAGYGAPASLDFVALQTLEELNIFRDVHVTNTTHGTEIEIRLYYTDVQAEKFVEGTLRPFWWNGTAWAECSNSAVNTANITIDANDYSGYMWAKITNTTTPSLANLQGTPWGGYGHPTQTPQPCCAATVAAASGTNAARKLDILREFRDTVLLPNSLGAKFVSLYYKTSPPIANVISQHEVLRTAVRVGFVDPIVKISTWSHDLWSARSS